MIRNIPLPIKILLCFIVFPIFAIIWYAAAANEMSKTLKAATQNPDIDTVGTVIEAWTRIIVGIDNHPDSWNELRSSWYKINGSDQVPTYMKRDLLAIFKKKGLRISNERIIDNYKD